MKDAETLLFLQEAKTQAEYAQAMFGGIKAVLDVTEDSVCRHIKDAPFNDGIKSYLDYHATTLQELIGVVSHLLMEMETQQDALVHLLSQKFFELNKE